MSAIVAVSVQSPSQQPINQENPQQNRVTESTKSIFEQAKEVISRAWRATVIGITTGFEKISFVFFRALEWIHPSLGPKVEVVFLRVANIWQGIKDAWRQEEIRSEIDGLKADNQDLQIRVRELTQASQENERLRLENSRLAAFEQLSHTHEQRIQSLLQQQNNLTDRETAVIGQRDIILLENNKLKEENVQLTNQRNAAAALTTLSFAKQNGLQTLLQSVRQEAHDLRAQIANNRELDQNLASIANACASLPQRTHHQKSEIDDGLEKLLPQLRGQIDKARANLDQAKQNLPLHSAAEIPLQSLDRILTQLVKYLDRVPKALQLHANWQQPVTQIFQNHLVEV